MWRSSSGDGSAFRGIAVIPGSDPESVEDKGCAYTAPESTFVASACECSVAVQGDSPAFMGDGFAFRVTGGRFRVHEGRFRPLHAGVFFHFR